MRLHFYGSLLLGKGELMGATARNRVLPPRLPTLKTSASSSRLPGTSSRSMTCSTKSSLGVAR